MSTVNEIITSAMRLCRIRDTSNASRMDEALLSLNHMIMSWEESLINNVVSESLAVVSGTASYSIGSGGDFDTVRPLNIISAYLLSSDGISYPINTQMSIEDYNKISDKTNVARPLRLFYNASNTLAYIYFDSVPDDSYTLVLTSKKPFTGYVYTTDTILQPIEYEKAMIYNLAIDIAPEYGIELPNTVIQQAVNLKSIIETRNTNVVPVMEIDESILRCK